MGAISVSPDTAVVVTGGASGIGRACAEALLDCGRGVVLLDRNTETLAKTIADLGSERVFAAAVDVTDQQAVTTAVDDARAALGTIGALVHAAGVVRTSPIENVDWDDWAFVLNVNLTAYARCVQALMPDLRSAPGAAVVGIASIDAHVGHAHNHAYCASKGGVTAVSRSLAVELGPAGIRVNAVCPGYIDTPMLAGSARRAGATEEMVGQSALGRIGQPAEIGRTVRFLLSDDASFITGAEIFVDGGKMAKP